MLKDDESGFAKWRKSFDLQVKAVWNGLDKLLEEIRGHDYVDVVIDEDVYRSLLLKAEIYPPAGSLDWNYKYISVKLYMVLYMHCGVDPVKVLEESSARCGLEAYRCISKAYDAYSSDSEVVLLNNIRQIGQWSVKGVFQADSMMREAKSRMTAWEKRSTGLVDDSMRFIINTMLFEKLDATVTKDVNAMAAQHPSAPKRVVDSKGTAMFEPA